MWWMKWGVNGILFSACKSTRCWVIMTSGCEKSFTAQKKDLAKHALDDPVPGCVKLIETGIAEDEIQKLKQPLQKLYPLILPGHCRHLSRIKLTVEDFVFAPTVLEEKVACPSGKKNTDGWMRRLIPPSGKSWKYPRSHFIWPRMLPQAGRCFQEAATLAEPVGITAYLIQQYRKRILSAALWDVRCWLKPVVEVQFADYIYPGTEPTGNRTQQELLFKLWKIPGANAYQGSHWAWKRGGVLTISVAAWKQHYYPSRGSKLFILPMLPTWKDWWKRPSSILQPGGNAGNIKGFTGAKCPVRKMQKQLNLPPIMSFRWGPRAASNWKPWKPAKVVALLPMACGVYIGQKLLPANLQDRWNNWLKNIIPLDEALVLQPLKTWQMFNCDGGAAK